MSVEADRLEGLFARLNAAELRVGGVEEPITVSGQSPVVDVSNSAARNQITREALDTIPTNKTLEAFAALSCVLATLTLRHHRLLKVPMEFLVRDWSN